MTTEDDPRPGPRPEGPAHGEVPEKQLHRWKGEGGALPPEPEPDPEDEDDGNN
ncbi:hypothetical protein [Pseudarthrobacter sp. NS4]|uniref:hypothetical protein n=1 Tax=Pseudarthrobacter sp. NS4 TaxID=2973976 RepID=UPI002161580C|nr:hypothetical protein [Pseudarthrobacter sp. NS4]